MGAVGRSVRWIKNEGLEPPMPADISIGEKYRPALDITTPDEAAAYFERCVAHSMARWNLSRAAAERLERASLAYFAGYYGLEASLRVESLFSALPLGADPEAPLAAVDMLLKLGM